MAVQLKDNLGSADNGRAKSPAIWGDCPVLSILDGSVAGMILDDDFCQGGLITSPTTSAALVGLPYSGFGDTGSTITYADEIGGAVTLTSDGTDNDATQLFSLSHCFQAGLTKGPLWFEARIKLSALLTTESAFFIGLADSTAKTSAVVLTDTASALGDLNLVGFHALDTDTADVKPCYKSNAVTAVDLETVADALTEATYAKLGFKKDKTGLVTWYINNLPQATTFQTLNDLGTGFPGDVTLAPCVSLAVGAATGSQTLIMDWWRCVQLA
jgi:hypothetical protein